MAAPARLRPGDPPLILALCSGILLALSFPRYGLPAIAWIALTPLLVVLFRDPAATASPRRHPFVLGWVCGLAYFGGTVYWTGAVVTEFGGLPGPLGVVVAALLAAYLALFPALFAWALAICRRKFGARALLLAPAMWVASELGRTYFWSGFPWLLLGYSQTTVLPVAQTASLVGVFGMSALVAAVASALAGTVVARGGARWGALAATGAVLAALTVWGQQRLAGSALTGQGDPVRVAVVQGNIAQEQKWDDKYAGAILDTYLALTRQAAAGGADLVIWPESSTPFPFQDDRLGGERIRALVREAGIELLLGSDQIDRQTGSYYNAAFMVGGRGEVSGVYRKMHLVPFGEFVPLQDVLFFVGPLVEAAGAFTAGEGMVMLPTAGGPISTAICYEIVFPGLVGDSVRQGSRLLTTITNDAWYGRSSAPHQHFLQASMRAIEQGRYLARAANTGISGFVDPYGRVLQRSALFEPAVLIEDLRLLEPATVYGRIGDLFAYLCAAVAAAALLVPGGPRGYRSR